MLNQLRNSKAFHLFWGFMAMVFLNISVDAVNSVPNYITENVAYNEQESIVEIVIEKIFGFEDAMTEYDNQDSDDQNKSNSVKLNLISDLTLQFSLSEKPFVDTKKPNYLMGLRFMTIGYHQLETPPPKG